MLNHEDPSVEQYRNFIRNCNNSLKMRKIGIVDGPISEEDKLYIKKAKIEDLEITAIVDSFRRLNINYVIVDLSCPGWMEILLSCDILFINIHGEYGEDGRLQGLLDILGKPYLGSGTMVSAVGLHKPAFKKLVKSFGFNTPKFVWPAEAHGDIHSHIACLQFPIMAKPIHGGSSIGMKKIDDMNAYEQFYAKLGNEVYQYFFEEFVSGRIVTVALLEINGDFVVFPPLEIVPEADFYDEFTKLNSQGGDVKECRFPQDLASEYEQDVRQIAYEIFRRLGGRSFCRVDFMVDAAGVPWVLEVNTIPGLSRAGNFPTCAAAGGFTYDDIIVSLLLSCRTSLEPDVAPPIAPPFRSSSRADPVAPIGDGA